MLEAAVLPRNADMVLLLWVPIFTILTRALLSNPGHTVYPIMEGNCKGS